jgi:PiT family inorganic phosphate transporter
VNGFHDAANSIATVVSTRVLTPRIAVLWAAFFNFVAAFGFGTRVAKTIGTGMVDPHAVTLYVILAGLVGAIAWDLITWYFGLPTSSSHALIGGLGGAAIAHVGLSAIISRGWYRTLSFIILSPIIGMILGLTFMVAVRWIFRKALPSTVDKYFGKLQLLSAGFYSLGHGTNDAQKTMGVIALVLALHREQTMDLKSFAIPIWVIFACYGAIGLGTMFGGWRIVKTMGQKVTKLKPVGGFCAETAGAITLIGTALAGIPVSTTHTITGAIMGVGATRRLSSVRWGVANRIVWAWVLTIPLSALISSLTYFLMHWAGFC